MLQKPALVVVKYIVAAFNKAFRKFTLLNNCFFLHRAQHTKKNFKNCKRVATTSVRIKWITAVRMLPGEIKCQCPRSKLVLGLAGTSFKIVCYFVGIMLSLHLNQQKKYF